MQHFLTLSRGNFYAENSIVTKFCHLALRPGNCASPCSYIFTYSLFVFLVWQNKLSSSRIWDRGLCKRLLLNVQVWLREHEIKPHVHTETTSVSPLLLFRPAGQGQQHEMYTHRVVKKWKPVFCFFSPITSVTHTDFSHFFHRYSKKLWRINMKLPYVCHLTFIL